MVDFTPITVGNDRPISVTLSNNESKFTDIDTMMTRIQVLFAALDPTGPNGPVNPDGSSTGIPLVFKTQTDESGTTRVVQADISSTAAFQQSLNGLTINAGESVIASTSNANAFGTSVGRGDALFAKVNNPTQDITNTSDWLRLEGDDSYSITLSERNWINTLNEDDVAVRVADVSDTVTVTFYLLNTAATVDGDLTGGSTGSFHQTTDQRNGILYVRLSPTYVSNFGKDNIYVEVTDPGGVVSTYVALSTFTERTDLLTAGDDVFESAGFPQGTSINYAAGQTIRLWQTRLSREWYFTAAFDVLRGLPDYTIPITKLDPATQALIRDSAAVQLQALENQLQVLRPLAVDVNILTDWADIYDPAQASETVRIVDRYSLLADFRGTLATEHYESAGVTYTDGTDVIDYSGLTDGLFRSIGFEVSGASNLTTVSLGNGGSVATFFDITSGGNVRVNDATPARTNTEVISDHYVPGVLDTGTGVIAVGGAASTYNIPTYPSDTDEATRTISIDVDVLVNGVDTLAGGFITEDNGLSIPNDETAQAKQTANHAFQLGPLHGNRTVNITIGFEYRKVGADFLLDLTLESAPSDVTLSIRNVETFQTYTATSVIARADNWRVFQDSGGNFTFSGEHEFLFEIVPLPGDDTRIEIVGAAISASGTTTQFNNIVMSLPPEGFDEIQIPDTIEFRTFKTDHYITHTGLVGFLQNRAVQWVYELARLETVTGHAITEAVDLNSGSTINGNEFSRDISSAISGTGSEILTLPSDYTDFELLHVTVLEDGGQLMHAAVSTRELDKGDNANVRIAGNDFAAWLEAGRTLTLHETADTYREALLFAPRLS